jgi:hypothetical protein
MRKINRRWCIVAPAMRLAKDTVACLTIVSLGEGLNRRYYQRSSFPSLMPHVETRRGARVSQHRCQRPFFWSVRYRHDASGPRAREATRAGRKRPGRMK